MSSLTYQAQGPATFTVIAGLMRTSAEKINEYNTALQESYIGKNPRTMDPEQRATFIILSKMKPAIDGLIDGMRTLNIVIEEEQRQYQASPPEKQVKYKFSGDVQEAVGKFFSSHGELVSKINEFVQESQKLKETSPEILEPQTLQAAVRQTVQFQDPIWLHILPIEKWTDDDKDLFTELGVETRHGFGSLRRIEDFDKKMGEKAITDYSLELQGKVSEFVKKLEGADLDLALEEIDDIHGTLSQMILLDYRMNAPLSEDTKKMIADYLRSMRILSDLGDQAQKVLAVMEKESVPFSQWTPTEKEEHIEGLRQEFVERVSSKNLDQTCCGLWRSARIIEGFYS